MAAFAKWGEILEKSRATFREEKKLLCVYNIAASAAII
jgi:hypothetical protein